MSDESLRQAQTAVRADPSDLMAARRLVRELERVASVEELGKLDPQTRVIDALPARVAHAILGYRRASANGRWVTVLRDDVTLQELANFQWDDLRGWKRIGPKSLATIEATLARAGLRLVRRAEIVAEDIRRSLDAFRTFRDSPGVPLFPQIIVGVPSALSSTPEPGTTVRSGSPAGTMIGHRAPHDGIPFFTTPLPR